MNITNLEYAELQHAKKQSEKYHLLETELTKYLLSDKFKVDQNVNVNDILMRMAEIRYAE